MKTTDKIPEHVAIIMDGNGRWAQQRGQERLYGHLQGVESVRRSVDAALQAGVGYLTLYVFSTENWGRPRQEVDGLMELFCKCVIGEMELFLEKGVRVRVIGDREAMSQQVVQHIETAERQTAAGKSLTLVLALNYGSREEITSAVRHLAVSVAAGETAPADITPEAIAANLYTADMPDPDLVIRTSGELRLSNYLLWQAAYAELYFTDTLWPDFGKEDFAAALAAYASRKRRYGRVEAAEDNAGNRP